MNGLVSDSLNIIHQFDSTKLFIELSNVASQEQTNFGIKEISLIIGPAITLIIALVSFYFNNRQLKISEKSLENAQEIASQQINAEIVKKRDNEIIDKVTELISVFLSKIKENVQIQSLRSLYFQLEILLKSRDPSNDLIQNLLKKMQELVDGLENEELWKKESERTQKIEEIVELSSKMVREIHKSVIE